MKRRMLAMLLLAAMVLCMIAPAYAVQQTEEARKIYSPEAPTKATYGEDYVVPFSWTYNSAVVAGGTIEFKFKLNITTPHPDTDKFVFQIFRGTASEVAKDKSLKAIVRQEYSMSQFAAPQNALSITWTAGADFPAGDAVRDDPGVKL